MNFKIKSGLAIVALIGALLTAAAVSAQYNPPTFSGVSFYVVAHQDDWQLFMGSNVYNDLQDFDPKKPTFSRRKVVIIYTTAGNLHDDDDTHSCECKDPNNRLARLPYWKVREVGARNSLHLGACRHLQVAAGIPYPQNRVDVINGHAITNYHFKNTSTYYLRMKAIEFSHWNEDNSLQVNTVDSSTTYADWSDFVNTLEYIYKKEMGIDVPDKNPIFNFPDINRDININDHPDHYETGRAACEAARLLGDEWHKCFPESLYIDYDTQNMPENLSMNDALNKSAITGAYCLALLDHNAWAEWGDVYREWNKRSYSRNINSCEQPRHSGDVLAEDGLDKQSVKIYPNPANQDLQFKFNRHVATDISIRITDVTGIGVFSGNTKMDGDNTLTVSTSSLPMGAYMAVITDGSGTVSRIIFQVLH